MTLTGENKKTQVHYFNAADLDVSDVQFDAQDSVAPEEKKATLLQLLEAGVLTGEDGKLTEENKARILDAFGFGSYENAKDISALHYAKASEENLEMKTHEVEVDSFDDHALHINEHTRFLLSAEFKRSAKAETLKARFAAHIEKHKKIVKEEKRAEQVFDEPEKKEV